MAKILEMPKLSPTMEEGVLSAWHKKEGDAVEVDDLLAEVETDKATMEFRAFDKGTLVKLLVPPGAVVKLGQPVAVLGTAGEDVSAILAGLGPSPIPAPSPSPAPAPALAPAPSPPPTPVSARTPAPPPRRSVPLSRLDRTEHEAARSEASDGRVLASPYVRKVAREMGIALEGTRGSGPGGRVALSDLERLRESPSPPSPMGETSSLAVVRPALPAAGGLTPPEVRPLSMMRKTIARRLTESKTTVPHFYLTIDIDAGKLVELREKINEELGKSAPPHAPNGADAPPRDKVTINDLLTKACAIALTRVPECNAQFAGDAIHVFRRVDVSVAVAVPDGLVTPVVRNADTKSVVAIAREVRDLAARARGKKLSLEEMTNGTFSISNLGMFGIDAFSAVINPPEGAILAVGRIRDEAVAKDGQVAAGKKLALTLSCDHRVIDGAVGASCLAELRALLEHPMRVLTG
jgi:pyruvate dehydrogenase E2 component (dihydrolipoamide acetyltransferase)